MRYILYLTLLVSLSVGCNKTKSNCDSTVQINAAAYQATTTINYQIQEAVINEDCLSIKFTSSGCDGSSWETDLFDADITGESLPVQRRARLALVNKEVCNAIVTKTISFDLTRIRVPTERTLIIQLEGWGGQLTYRY